MFFFQAEDGIRDIGVTGVQTCALPICAVLTTAALFPMWFLLTLYTQEVLGYTPLEAGLAQLPIALLIVLAAAPTQQLVTRIGPRIPFAAGLTLVAGGLFWFSQVSAGGSFLADVLGPSVLAGIGAAMS